MAADVTYLEWPLSFEEVRETLTSLHSRKLELQGAVEPNDESISAQEIRVKIATVDLTISKFQRLLWRIQGKQS